MLNYRPEIHDQTYIYTKENKFQLLFSGISYYQRRLNHYKGIFTDELVKTFSTSQRATYKKIQRFYISIKAQNLEENSEKYTPFINQAYSLLREILDDMPDYNEIYNGKKTNTDPFLKAYGFLNHPEDNRSKTGSPFTIEIDGLTIKKCDEDSFEFVKTKKFTTLAHVCDEWLNHMGQGVYTIDGVPFKLLGRPLRFNMNMIVIRREDLTNHPLIKYFKRIRDIDTCL